MELIVLLLVIAVVGGAGLRWGVDTREAHNNWDRV